MLLCAGGVRNQGEPFVHDLPHSSDAREKESKLCSKTVAVKDDKLISFVFSEKKKCKNNQPNKKALCC